MRETFVDKATNPLTRLDYPDPDVIRVKDTYYMVTTTMHFMPGCEILRSYDLQNWEHAAYVYERLDGTPAQRLEGKENIYGKGMWAASLRYHKGHFYICFVANDTGKTYLYTAKQMEGPWEKREIEGFYHDASLLFDEDDSVYIVYGNRHIYLTQLKEDLSGPKEGGLNRLIISDEGNPILGYEGAHFYKIKGKYYVFLIHSLKEEWKRVEACFMAESLEAEFVGGDILNDDMGYGNQGVAQGGIVDTPKGQWYSILFQDRGAVGRIPVLIPFTWDKGFPVFGKEGKVPENIITESTKSKYRYTPLISSDDFGKPEALTEEERACRYGCFGLKSVWQFNHEPDLSLVEQDKGGLLLRTDKLCENITQAKNTLTQRMIYPGCFGEVTVDMGGLQEGDYAGLCAFQGCYGFVGVTIREGRGYLVMVSKQALDSHKKAFEERDDSDNSNDSNDSDNSNGSDNRDNRDNSDDSDNSNDSGYEQACIPVEGNLVRLGLDVDFTNGKDEAEFFYFDEAASLYRKIGRPHKLYFKLDHFTGCRFGLFVYSTRKPGGFAKFTDFVYKEKK